MTPRGRRICQAHSSQELWPCNCTLTPARDSTWPADSSRAGEAAVHSSLNMPPQLPPLWTESHTSYNGQSREACCARSPESSDQIMAAAYGDGTLPARYIPRHQALCIPTTCTVGRISCLERLMAKDTYCALESQSSSCTVAVSGWAYCLPAEKGSTHSQNNVCLLSLSLSPRLRTTKANLTYI